MAKLHPSSYTRLWPVLGHYSVTSVIDDHLARLQEAMGKGMSLPSPEAYLTAVLADELEALKSPSFASELNGGCDRCGKTFDPERVVHSSADALAWCIDCALAVVADEAARVNVSVGLLIRLRDGVR